MIFKGRIYKKCPKVTVTSIENQHMRFSRVVKGEYVPIGCKGHSLTNLMYGTDGYMYLSLNGECYRAPTPEKAEGYKA